MEFWILNDTVLFGGCVVDEVAVIIEVEATHMNNITHTRRGTRHTQHTYWRQVTCVLSVCLPIQGSEEPGDEDRVRGTSTESIPADWPLLPSTRQDWN